VDTGIAPENHVALLSGGLGAMRWLAERPPLYDLAATPALKGRNLISLALQRQVRRPPIPIRPEGAEPDFYGSTGLNRSRDPWN